MYAIVVVIVWKNFDNCLLPLVILNRDSIDPWPLGVMDRQGEYSTDWQLVLTFVTFTILPAVTMFIVAQKPIAVGLAAGVVKDGDPLYMLRRKPDNIERAQRKELHFSCLLPLASSL
jgi:ABC-type maltose transport system permease subunit